MRNRTWKLLSGNTGLFLLALAVGVAYSLLCTQTPMVSGNLVNAVIAGQGGGRQLCLLVACCLAQVALCVADEFLGKRFFLQQKRRMRDRAFQAFAGRGGDLEARSAFVSFCNNDIPTIAEQYLLGVIDIVKCVCLLLFSALSLFRLHGLLALVILGISSLIILLPRALRRQGSEARQACARAMAGYNAHLQSFLGGQRLLKSHGCLAWAAKRMEACTQETASQEQRLYRSHLVILSLTGFLQTAKTCLILVIGVWLISRGRLQAGSLLAAVQLAELISAPIEVLAYAMHSRNEARPLAEQYETILATAPGEGTAPLDRVQSISVENLACSAGQTEILHCVSHTFEAGRKYLITGESGSGKSTLLRLLGRTGDLDYTGHIRCNGIEATEISPRCFCKAVCSVPQEPYLFHATLEENILLGRDISKADYTAILDRLGLTYLLDRDPDRELDPEAVEALSGGERQRIALARAMAGRPQVYLLDEVTSALDMETAQRVEALLLEQPAMVIHVSHKPSPALGGLYDETLHMRQGTLE